AGCGAALLGRENTVVVASLRHMIHVGKFLSFESSRQRAEGSKGQFWLLHKCDPEFAPVVSQATNHRSRLYPRSSVSARRYRVAVTGRKKRTSPRRAL